MKGPKVKNCSCHCHCKQPKSAYCKEEDHKIKECKHCERFCDTGIPTGLEYL